MTRHDMKVALVAANPVIDREAQQITHDSESQLGSVPRGRLALESSKQNVDCEVWRCLQLRQLDYTADA